MEQRPT